MNLFVASLAFMYIIKFIKTLKYKSLKEYCNSVMYGELASNIRKMQTVLNASVQLITGHGRFDLITPALRDELHWLPVLQHIGYDTNLRCLRSNVFTTTHQTT